MVVGEIYHVYNRGIGGQPIYGRKSDYRRFLESMFYYQNSETPLRYSQFVMLPTTERQKLLSDLAKENNRLVEIICYCLMPNHFHVITKQVIEKGIALFISNLSNSYTRFYNVKYDRDGPLFKGKFQAVRIEDDEQLLHTTRYIHLNPYTSYITKTADDLLSYPYSSFNMYRITPNDNRINTTDVLSHFSSIEKFTNFTLDQRDYQRRLGDIKHLIHE